MGRIWSVVPRIVKQRLAWASAGSVLLPWLVGEYFKTAHQPGLDNDSLRTTQFIDILVIGVVIFALTMVFTVALGCIITAVMKGPQHLGDPFPVVTPRE